MFKKLIIAIDGPAGSGKSTVSKLVARRLGLLYLDTGAMYRALTLKAMNKKIDLNDAPALVRMTEDTKLAVETSPSADSITVLLDGEDVTRRIRTPEVTENIKYIARVPGVRHCMVATQRAIASKSGAVLEGRDTTTVVFPDAAYKFYLDASIEERASRRFKELKAAGIDTALARLKEDVRLRDESDKTRSVGALTLSKDAIYIDTSKMTIGEVVEKMLGYIENK